MLCKNPVYNGIGLEVYTPVDFLPIMYSVPLPSFNLTFKVLIINVF